MSKRYSDDFKRSVIKRHLAGEKIVSLAKEVGVSPPTISKWISLSGEKASKVKKDEDELRERVLKAYADSNNVSEAAREAGCCRQTAKKYISEASSKANQLIDPDSVVDLGVLSKRHRFVVTSALNNCPIHHGFLNALHAYCDANDAELLVIPVRYKNVSLYTGTYEPWWPSELDSHYVTGDLELSSNVVIMGSMRIQATAAQPLSRTPGIAKGRSAVFGHPRIALETVATPLDKYPMVYMTTGSISLPEYSETKAGRLGEFHHSIAATIVETDGERFWWRHVHAQEDGSFIDIDNKYFCDGDVLPAPQAEAMVAGDVHVGFDDPSVVQALFRDLMGQTSCKKAILHDVLDFFSDSHHHQQNRVLQVMKAARDRNSVYGELSQVAEWFQSNCSLPGAQYYVVRSNHHDHLERWLDSPKLPNEAKNLYLWHKLNADRLGEALAVVRCNEDEWSVTSAFELAMREMLSGIGYGWEQRVVFHDDRQPLEICGIDVSNHGDRGPNGSRGSRAAFAKVQRRTIIGHSHSPGIKDGCYQVGMSCIPNPPYVSGYSSWLAVAALINGDGTRTLLPVIGGKYRL